MSQAARLSVLGWGGCHPEFWTRASDHKPVSKSFVPVIKMLRDCRIMLLVALTDLYVLDPVPGNSVLTLQTCTLPDYSRRLIVQAELKS